MCKLNKKNDGRRIDPCMREELEGLKPIVKALNRLFPPGYKVVACCCGHGKYPKTLVIQNKEHQKDVWSGKIIPRRKKFYKKDKQGYYFIPEVIESINKRRKQNESKKL